MCGIAGVLHFDGVAPDGAGLARMSATMRERGPDDEGAWIGAPAGLVHRRLSILDLSPRGRCPMQNEDGSVRVVFNGELYNHSRLRAELVARGHAFRSRSDTEVLVHGYEEWNTALVERLDGMFAFAIWDARARRLVLARDRVGEKPLYYKRDGSLLVFASTLNAITAYRATRPGIDAAGLECYLSHAYIPATHTIWAGVDVFPPAHYAICEAGGRFTVEPYWSLPSHAPAKIRIDEAERVVETLLDNGVRDRLVADVDVGALLSGGVDSSLVAAIAARQVGRLQTFSIGFDEARFSELPHARRVAEHLGAEHHELIVKPEALLESVAELVWQVGQPFGDPSIVATHAVARLASAHVKVCLSGDGGDESFAGYWRTAAGWYASLYRRALPGFARARLIPHVVGGAAAVGGQSFARRLGALNTLSLAEPGAGYTNSQSWFDWRARILGPAMTLDAAHDPARCRAGRAGCSEDWSEIQRLLYDDFDVQLPDAYLSKVDVASMAASVEVRAPFLDHRLVETVWRFPDRLKLRWGVRKWLLKRIAARHVPPEVVHRPKMGFALPLHEWWHGRLASVLAALLDDSRAVGWGWIRREPVADCLARHRAGAEDHTMRLWLVLWLELWARIVVEGSLSRSTTLAEVR